MKWGADVSVWAAVAVTSLAIPSAAALPASVPVVDAFVIDIPIDGGASVARFEGAIHGAYRVPEGTVLYWSLRESSATDVGLQAAFEYDDVDLVGGVLADPRSLNVLLPLYDGERCLCTTSEDLDPELDSSRFTTMYTTFPAIPAETRTLDVDVDGRGTIVVDVPVSAGLPDGPQLDSGGVTMGEGWPAVPDGATLREVGARDPQDLVGRSGPADGQATTEGTGDDRLILFDSDVLFGSDRADLSPEAREVVTAALATLETEQAAVIEVVGHTDWIDTDAYNLELSLRRAQTVADVLAAELTDGPEIKVVGRGEAEPIASNETEEGRAQNRRVTISYSTEGG